MTAAGDASILLRRAQLPGRGVADVRWRAGSIAAIAPALPPVPGERVIEARGGVLLPGLIDHHCHLFATAAARASLQCGPPAVRDEAGLRRLLAQAAAAGTPIRGVGYHEAVCPDLDRDWLDRVCGPVPARIQHRSGMLWVLNSAAMAQLALPTDEALPAGAERDDSGRLSGRFYDLDDWLGAHWQRNWPSLATLSADYARFGVTAVTDTGVNNGPDEWQALLAACQRREWRQRLQVMGTEALPVAADSCRGRMSRGPLKLYLREVALPPFDDWVQRIGAAHQLGRAVAIHCVTLVELHFALAALAEVGVVAGDRIEHASVADDAAIERIAELGVTVVSQPHFIAERGDQYLRTVEARDLPYLYRAATFLRQGVRFAAGSDAPYGDINPWAAMAAAMQRRTANGQVMAAEEALDAGQALALFAGNLANPGSGMTALAEGQPADLCLLGRDWQAQCREWSCEPVALTVCAGEILYSRSDQSVEEC